MERMGRIFKEGGTAYTQKRDIMRQILSSNPAPLYSTHLTHPYVLPDDEGWVMHEKSKTKRNHPAYSKKKKKLRQCSSSKGELAPNGAQYYVTYPITWEQARFLEGMALGVYFYWNKMDFHSQNKEENAISGKSVSTLTYISGNFLFI